MLKLYDYWRSSAAYRVRIGLHLKGVEFESVPVNILPGVDEHRGEAYHAINPQMRVPALETPHGVLTQSLSILVWLDQTYRDNPFVPADPWASAQVRAFALTIGCDIHPLNNTSVIGRLKSQFEADDPAIASWYVHWMREGFKALEKQLEELPVSTFAFGDAPSLADICLVPQCANARRFKFDFSDFPRIAALDQRARGHVAFQKAAPENQKDAVKS